MSVSASKVARAKPRPDKGVSQSVLKFCEQCGKKTKHYKRSAKCRTCSLTNSIRVDRCSVHGETKFQGKSCKACVAQSAITFANCDVHGKTKFQGSGCSKCNAGSERFSTDWCKACDSKTTHQLGTCMQCNRGGFVTGQYKELKHCVLSSFDGCAMDFLPSSGAQTVCKADHEAICQTCFKGFILNPQSFRMRYIEILEASIECDVCRQASSLQRRSEAAKNRDFPAADCLLCHESFHPTTNKQLICTASHVFACSTTNCARSVTIQANTQRSGKNGKLSDGSLLALAQEGKLLCRQCSRRTSAPELAFIEELDLSGEYLRGVGQIDGLDEDSKIAFEYDGSYWHAKDGSIENDQAKTRKLLAMGYQVVRIREEKLPFLDIDDENLHQYHFPYANPVDEEAVKKMATVIRKALR